MKPERYVRQRISPKWYIFFAEPNLYAIKDKKIDSIVANKKCKKQKYIHCHLDTKKYHTACEGRYKVGTLTPVVTLCHEVGLSSYITPKQKIIWNSSNKKTEIDKSNWGKATSIEKQGPFASFFPAQSLQRKSLTTKLSTKIKSSDYKRN